MGDFLDNDDLDVFRADLKTAILLAVIKGKTLVIKWTDQFGEIHLSNIYDAFHFRPNTVAKIEIIEK